MVNQNNRKKYIYATELARNIILALLVVSMILLVVMYIGGTHIYQSMTTDESERPFDKLWSVQSDVNTEGLDATRMLPEFIGYKLASSTPVGCMADRESALELYNLITPCLIELFGSSGICVGLDAQSGQQLFSEAASGSEYIYIRYHVPVMYQLIFAYASEKLVISDSDVAHLSSDLTNAYISEIIIIPDNNVAAHRFVAYAFDGSDRYFMFRLEESVLSSSFYMSRLSDEQLAIKTYPFDFADIPALSISQPMLDAELEAEVITSNESGFDSIDTRNSLLRLFDFNPDKLSSYIDDDAEVFVRSTSRLRLGGGRISYQASDIGSGVTLRNLLGYSVNDGLSLYDQLTAADNLIRSIGEISNELIGGEAALCLGDVYTENGLLYVEFFYTYANIRISDEPAAVIAMSQESLYSFTLETRAYTGTDEYTHSPTQHYIIEKLLASGSLGTGHDAQMVFAYRDGKAIWSARYDALTPVLANSFTLR